MTKPILAVILLVLLSFKINAQELKKVNFDEKFQKEYQDKAKIEINEVKELLHIMIAMTDFGLGNDDMIEQKGSYYKEVINHFENYKNEEIIVKIDSLMKENPLEYIFLTGNAIAYNFEGDKLVKSDNYIFPAQNVSQHTIITVNPITTIKKEIEDFAIKTKFRSFYQNQKTFYEQIISDYNEQANIKAQWEWLEKNFDRKVNNYTIMCSPLIGGLNYTTSYVDNGFTQVLLVLPVVEQRPEHTEIENQVLNTRFMFTEIDHNYVGQPSKKHLDQINSALKDREKWLDTTKYGTEYYPNPLAVFDEYMTFAVFYLYCFDLFKENPEALKFAYENINTKMIEDRGFPKMKVFNDKLLELRIQNPTIKIQDLYPLLIEWCEKV